MPHAAAHVVVARLEMEVRAVGVLRMREVGLWILALDPRERRAEVGLVGRLVLGEPGVAIDPEDRTFRVGLHGQLSGSKRLGEARDECLHRLLQERLVLGLAGLEPAAVVVLGELRQEVDRIWAEAGKAADVDGHDSGPPSDLRGHRTRLRSSGPHRPVHRHYPASRGRVGRSLVGAASGDPPLVRAAWPDTRLPQDQRPVRRPRLGGDGPADPSRTRCSALGALHRALPDRRGAGGCRARRRPSRVAGSRLRPARARLVADGEDHPRRAWRARPRIGRSARGLAGRRSLHRSRSRGHRVRFACRSGRRQRAPRDRSLRGWHGTNAGAGCAGPCGRHGRDG